MARRPGILIAALLIAATVAPVPGIARDHGDYRDRDRHHGGGGATSARGSKGTGDFLRVVK